MGNAILSGVSGLSANQRMLDVTGNNLANVNTAAFKGSRITFADLLSETLRQGSGPSGGVGGINPIQVGSGVKTGSIDRVMTQGGLVSTGQELDMAIEGQGYFALTDGRRDIYTRVGSFAVDADNYLVDSGTGFRVMRYGDAGESDAFQIDQNIRIPYDVSISAKTTENATVVGVLATYQQSPTTNDLSSIVEYTVDGGTANEDTLLADLDQVQGIAEGDTIAITGVDRDGNAVNATYTIGALATATVGDLLDAITGAFDGSTATISSTKQIHLTDDTAGYSKTDLNLAYDGDGTFELPGYFQIDTAGGDVTQNIGATIYDSQGTSHLMTAAFVRNTDDDCWDLVLTSMTGLSSLTDRRIEGITFQEDGAYGGIGGATPDSPTFEYTFEGYSDPVTLNMQLGTEGRRDGITLNKGLEGKNLTKATVTNQDGYTVGTLTSISVTPDGSLIGLFTNSLQKALAAVKLATFSNPTGLTAIGNSFFEVSGNSGDAKPTGGQAGGAGAVRGGMLEKSNVDIATEFVNLIQAQNGYQANARTVKVANDMLRELATLLR